MKSKICNDKNTFILVYSLASFQHWCIKLNSATWLEQQFVWWREAFLFIPFRVSTNIKVRTSYFWTIFLFLLKRLILLYDKTIACIAAWAVR